MRMPPNQRRMLDRGHCIWCGNSYIGHRDGAHFMEHHEMYASSYNSTLTEGQRAAIQEWADKLDKIQNRVAKREAERVAQENRK